MSDRTQSHFGQQQDHKEMVAMVSRDFDKQMDKYVDRLPSTIPAEDFRNAFLIAVQANARLLQADRSSLWLALQRAASDGLKPDGREGALVIFGDDSEDEEGRAVQSTANQKKRVVWMPMVWGLTKLARNTGNVASIRAKCIYAGETLVVRDVDGVESYEHVRAYPNDLDMTDDKIVGAYAVVQYKDGTYDFEAMTSREIERVRAVSRAKSPKAPWAAWKPEMFKKTPLRRLLKRVPRARELERITESLDHDQTIEGDPALDLDLEREIASEFSAAEQKASAESIAKVSAPPQETEAPKAKPRQTRKAPEVSEPVREPVPEPEPEGDIWPYDEYGEPPDGPAQKPMTALQFAWWYAGRLSDTKNHEALADNNADALDAISKGEHGVEPRFVLDKAHNVMREKARDTAPKPTPPAERKPIHTLTPQGKLHEPNFRSAAKAEIAALTGLDDMADWVRVNKATYAGKAVEIAVENALKARRAEWDDAAAQEHHDTPAEEQITQTVPDPPPSTPSSGTPIASLEGKNTAQVLEAVRSSMPNIHNEEQLREWASRDSIGPYIKGVKSADPDRYRMIVGVIDERRMQFDIQGAG